MADIDNFKTVNDTHGHPKGDEVLELVARNSQKVIRGGDIVGRYGGEEFAVLMVNADVDNAANAAERYREMIQKTLFLSRKGDFSVTASFLASPTEGVKHL